MIGKTITPYLCPTLFAGKIFNFSLKVFIFHVSREMFHMKPLRRLVFGAPRIGLGPYAPKAYILPLYYAPIIIFSNTSTFAVLFLEFRITVTTSICQPVSYETDWQIDVVTV